jgi:L-threonylcarbamoyladenylate synthase
MEKTLDLCTNHQSEAECYDQLMQAVSSLNSGDTVIYPTDTLYGLGVDAFDESGLQNIFHIKGRSFQESLPLLVESWDMVNYIAQGINESGLRLSEKFWPGSLTLVFTANERISKLVTGDRDTVAVRQPNHWLALEIIKRFGGPIVGTSANFSGEPNFSNYSDLKTSLGHLVGHIVSCGPDPLGVGSTVVDVSTGTPNILREGSISKEDILEALC